MKVLSEVANDALELTPAERRTLALILLELSEEDQDFSPEVEASWDDEISRRMEAVRTRTARHSPFAEVFARLDMDTGDGALASPA